MANWVNVASVDEIQPGSYKTIDLNDVLVAVFNIGGTLYAIEDVCTHDGGVLTSPAPGMVHSSTCAQAKW